MENRKLGFGRNLVAIIAFALVGFSFLGCSVTPTNSEEQKYDVGKEMEFKQRIGVEPYDGVGIVPFSIKLWGLDREESARRRYEKGY